jgi:hypothetical protein
MVGACDQTSSGATLEWMRNGRFNSAAKSRNAAPDREQGFDVGLDDRGLDLQPVERV